MITGAEKSSIYQHFLTLRANRFYENGFLMAVGADFGYHIPCDYGCRKVQYLSAFFDVKGISFL